MKCVFLFITEYWSDLQKLPGSRHRPLSISVHGEELRASCTHHAPSLSLSFCCQRPFKQYDKQSRQMLLATVPKVAHGYMIVKRTDSTSTPIKAVVMSVGSAHVRLNSPCCIFLVGFLPPCPAHIWHSGFPSHTDAPTNPGGRNTVDRVQMDSLGI